MSSEIMSRPVDVSRYALIYAGAQKNIAPAGLTVVIIDKSFAGHEAAITPQIMSYQKMIDKDSMLNTPALLVHIHARAGAGVGGGTGRRGRDGPPPPRAQGLVYEVLDNSRLYKAHAEPGSRSMMNVTFRTGDERWTSRVCEGAAERGLLNVKGHRLTGGMRVSLYNAMPLEGAKALAEYMKDFEVEHHV